MITKALAAVIAVLLLGLGLQTWRLTVAKQSIAAAELRHEQALRAQADAARLASEQARAEEHRRIEVIEGVVQDAQQTVAAAVRDAASAADVSRRLRERIAALSRPAPKGSATSIGGQAITGPGLLLAELFRRADDVAGELAEALDRSRTAGLACERAYQALR